MQKKYGKDGFLVVAVNDWNETTERVAAFAKKEKLEHLILVGGAAAAKISLEKYGVISSPTGFWIDHEGKILRRENGFHPGSIRTMERRIEDMLARRKVLRPGG